ncbi:hypothetical protein OAP63_05715 [Vibrio sp.]|nr:hypothetical protein [Vibrio sp.]
MSSPINVAHFTRVAGQLGTNPAGVYEDSHGVRFYVKNLESPMHARNEWLAAQLYKLTGAPTFQYYLSTDACQVITQWLNLDKKSIAHFNENERLQAQRWLAVHAWTANWDAVGYIGDNQGVYQNSVLTLDVGGALAYRAHGDPKGKAFCHCVEEINSLRSMTDNPYAKRLFGDMSPNAVRESISRIALLSERDINTTILDNGGSQKLADKMLYRREDLIQRSLVL